GLEGRGAVAPGSRVEHDDLPEEIRNTLPKATASGVVRPLGDIEKEYIVAALELNDGNQTRHAAQLHIGSATLYRKLKSYGLIGKPRTPSAGRRRHSVGRLKKPSGRRSV